MFQSEIVDEYWRKVTDDWSEFDQLEKPTYSINLGKKYRDFTWRNMLKWLTF